MGETLGIGFLGLGFSPKWTLAETPRMPKERYAIMTRYMPQVGSRGLDMMYRTATIQVNLDFAERSRHGQEAARVAGAAADRHGAVRLLAVHRRAPNGFKSMRSEVWRDTDRRRTGMLPFAFEDGMGYERYVDYALDVPMYFVYRDGRYIDAAGGSFRDFLDGKLPQLPGELPTLDDWSDHLTTLFPEVRLKRFLEMRGADGGPLAAHLRAVGLLGRACSTTLGARCGLGAGQGLDRRGARSVAQRRSEDARWRRRSERRPSSTSPAKCCASRAQGLRARRRINAASQDEAIYLDILDEVAISGCTLADRLIEHYQGPWQRDIDHVFEEYAF